MGGSSSSSPQTPPPSPTFTEPWRKISWGDNNSDLQYIKDFQPQNPDVQHIRVLLYGPIGTGKSNFINSVSSVLRGRLTTPALVCAKNDKSFTKKYETHKIQKGDRGNFYPFVFSDIMGLEDESGNGVRVDDIKLILKGHVNDGYTFNPVSPLTSSNESHYNSSPSPSDKVHVLVCVCSGNESEITKSVLEKMKEIREAASDLGIPQLAVVTKVDEACGVTEKNLRDVYRSKYVKKKMTDLSSALGIPMNCILPVKNYSDEISINDDVDSLILSTLRLVINFGDDFSDKF